jgi:hypothetical protein
MLRLARAALNILGKILSQNLLVLGRRSQKSLPCHLPILAAESILEKNSSKGTAEFEPDHFGTRVKRDRSL